MKNFNLLALFSILLIIQFSCTKKNATDFIDEVSSTDTVTYTGKIKSIIDVNCVSCHNENTANGGIRLHNYQEVKAVGESGSLYEVLITTDPVKKMPFGSSLPANEIEAIKMWIDQKYKE